MANATGDCFDVKLDEMTECGQAKTLKISIESLSRKIARVVQGELVYELAFLTFPPWVQTKIIMFLTENILKIPRDTVTALVNALRENQDLLDPWLRVLFMRLDYSRALLESCKNPSGVADYPIMSTGKTRKVEPFFISDNVRRRILEMSKESVCDETTRTCATDAGNIQTGSGQRMDIDLDAEDFMQLPDPDASALTELESLPDSPPIVSNIADKAPQQQITGENDIQNSGAVEQDKASDKMEVDIQPRPKTSDAKLIGVNFTKMQTEIANSRFENLSEILDTLLVDGTKGEIEFVCKEVAFTGVPANHMANILCVLEKHITPLGYVTSKNILHSIVFNFIANRSTPLPRTFVGNVLTMLKTHSKVSLRSVVIPLLLLGDFSQVTEELMSKISREKVLEQDAVVILLEDFFDGWIMKCQERALPDSVISTLQRFLDDTPVVFSPDLATSFLSFVETISSGLEKSLKFGKFLYTVISNNRQVFSPLKDRLTVEVKKNKTFMGKKVLKYLEQI